MLALLALLAVQDPKALAEVASYGDRIVVRKNVAYGAEAVRKLDLYLPKGSGPFPIVVCWFGGGFTGGGKEGMARVSAFLASEGLAAAAPNYTLATPQRPSWPQNLHDAKAAVRFLRAKADELNIDPERIAGLGSSSGSYLAMMVAFTPRIRELDATDDPTPASLRAVVNIAGVVDRRGGFGTGTRHLLGEGYESKAELRALASPILHVGTKSPPVYTLHGLKDDNVPPDSARQLDARLKEVGVPHTLQWVPDAGHNPLSPDALVSIARWLRDTMK